MHIAAAPKGPGPAFRLALSLALLLLPAAARAADPPPPTDPTAQMVPAPAKPDVPAKPAKDAKGAKDAKEEEGDKKGDEKGDEKKGEDKKDLQVYDEIKVTGRGSDMIGVADSATEGVTGHQELAERPILRPGEVLETVPGLIISQHSGDGKANQYYLRGFNLDHGTDFRITVDDIPVNMPSHGHGQGYSDLNFVIPELVDTVRYKKGLYYADEGDFSAAGAASLSYLNSLDKALVQVAPGTDGYERGLVAASKRVGDGDLLGAFEYLHNDGPWTRPDDYQKKNGLVRYSSGDAANGFSATFQGYDGKWNSTDQIPERAVQDGEISRFGSIDPSDGGSSSRYSLAAEVRRGDATSLTTFSAYALSYKLQLFSDFTYFLEDPVHGDQFEQRDDRTVEGMKLGHKWSGLWLGYEVENEVGLQARNDNIHNGLFHTEDQVELSVTRTDAIVETSIGPYGQTRIRWNDWLRTVVGLRADYFHFKVDSNLAANSGREDNAILSPKLSFLFGPWVDSEAYLNFGTGFHSNDARGTTITVEPRTGEPVQPVSPLVRAKSADVGFRTSAIPHLQLAFTLFRLDIDSELVFSGDAGDTEPSRPSRRTGFELQSFYRPLSFLSVDADYAVSRARFTDFDPVGDHIPGAIESAASIGVTVTSFQNAFTSLRWRYFGPRPLIEDDSVRSHSTSLFYFDVGYQFPHDIRLTLDVFNLFNVKASDVDYYYESQLRGEPQPVADIHFHPTESRTLRLVTAFRF